MNINVGKRVVIIGAGLSGLACGVHLTHEGFDVSIVEELTYPGGLLASTRMGKEYLELLPHHLRKSDKNLLGLIKSMGVDDKVQWFDSLWYGKAAKKKVGYFTDGFSGLINSMIQEITDNGGHILYSTNVYEISRIEKNGESPLYKTSCVLSNSSHYDLESEFVIFTGSCRNFVTLSHGLPININDRDELMNITYKARISIMMTLRHKLSDVYFQHTTDSVPFSTIVNHSNCFGERSYGGNIVYLVGECSTQDPIWIQSDSEIMDTYFKAFRKLYPGIKKSDVKAWRATKIRYALSEKYPATNLTMPCENLFVCAAGLTKYATSEEPISRMDSVVNLANTISKRIIEIASEKSRAQEDNSVIPLMVN